MNRDIKDPTTAKPEPTIEKAEVATVMSVPVAIEPRRVPAQPTALDNVDQLARLLGKSAGRGWR